MAEEAGARAAGSEIKEAGSGLGVVFFLAAIFFLNFLGRMVLSPLLPNIEQSLGLDHSASSSIFFFIALGYFLALFGSGFLSARLDHRRTIVVSALVSGAALMVMALSRNLWGFRLGFLAVGLGTGLYLPSGVAALTSRLDPRYWGRALAVHESAPNLSLVLAPVLVNATLVYTSWPGVLVLVGSASALLALAFALFGRGGRFKGLKPDLAALKSMASGQRIWILVALYCIGASGGLGVYSMLPLFLVSQGGLDPETANNLVALSRVPVLGLALVAGWATDRFGPRRSMTILLAASALLTGLLGLGQGGWRLAAVFLQPVISGCFFIPALAAVSASYPARERGLAVSFCAAMGFMVGAGFIPAGMGLLADAGFFGASFAAVGGLSLIGVYLVQRLRPA